MYVRRATVPRLTVVHVLMSMSVLNNASAGTVAVTTRLDRLDASACLGSRLAMMEGLVLVSLFTE